MRSVITGTGHYVPERVVTNEELVPVIGGTALWVTERTGILERRYAAAAQTTSELGEHAARRALEDAGIAPEDLDAVVFATLSPDVMFPGCGVFLTARLGLTATPALDVRNQCSGYLYALSVADAWIRAGVYARVLIVGAEIHSTGMRFDHEGRSLTALFGDGAGAVVLEGTEDDTRGVVEVRLGADGSGAEHLWCEAPGSRGGEHVTWEDLHAGRHFPTMNGRAVFRNAVSTLTREINALLQDHALPERERAELV
ncbi:MAG: ketoacyl-ACP synthase III, partial [Myxococcota bacterium]